MNAPPQPHGSSFRNPRTRLAVVDLAYPRELNDLADPPQSIWTEGVLDTLTVLPRVAIVGTRRSTSYGERITRELAGALARAGACVVSGLAVGIDGIAHRAALENGGTTIAVLGTGLNQSFPKANRLLQREIASKGLLITELDHDEHGWQSTFKERNRLIAALATLTIVVEAPMQSGALITANHADTLGRMLGAVPGPIDQPQSAGCNELLKRGVQVITSAEDALALVGLTLPPRVPRGPAAGDEGRIWEALAGGPLDMDALCHRSGLPAAQCLAAVTRLELAGSVECALTGEVRRR